MENLRKNRIKFLGDFVRGNSQSVSRTLRANQYSRCPLRKHRANRPLWRGFASPTGRWILLRSGRGTAALGRRKSYHRPRGRLLECRPREGGVALCLSHIREVSHELGVC